MAQASVPRAPAPISTPISDTDLKGKLTGYVPIPWSDYFNGIDAQLASSYLVLDHQQIAAASAAIPATPITGQALPAGLYRVSYYLVELQAATTSSSVQVTIFWTDRGVTRSDSGPALTGNALSVSQSRMVMVRSDRGKPIVYSVTYASVGAQPMVYSLDILLEQVLALPS